MPSPPKHALSIADLAALAGVSTTTWKSHAAQGCPVPKRSRDVRPWLRRYHQWRTEHGKVAPVKLAPPIDLETEKAKRETAKLRAALLGVELRQKLGEFISRKEVVAYCGRAVLAVRLRLDSTRTKMAARLQHSDSATIDEELGREFASICDDFAAGMGRSYEDQDATAGSGAGHSSQLAETDSADD